MSRHQQFSAAFLLIAASVALGACANDPTGVHPTVVAPSAPVGTQSKCTGLPTGGIHGDTIVEAVHGPDAARAAMPAKVVDCFRQ
jgi:hypothetical protein